jgi:uncharacterized protein (DUF2235 family)
MPNGGKAAAPRKPRNILIYSDGTGQRGGLYFDEARTNIYKLFRATRVAPDSTIDPDKQVAFYDPGLGTLPEGDSTLQRIYRKLYNFISQATGLFDMACHAARTSITCSVITRTHFERAT